MSLMVLQRSKDLTIATDQLVYSPAELMHLNSVIEQSVGLTELLANESQRIAAAEREAADLGYQRGYDAGMGAGEQAASEQAQALESHLHKQQQALNQSALQLAFDIVRRMAGNLDTSQLLAALASSAAQAFGDDELPLTLRVHPDYQSEVEQYLVAHHADGESVIYRVLGDDSLERHACIVESKEARVLADIDTQLSAMEMQARG